ncbi:MAG: transposase [Opitutaceae bacterium]|nr:transposase [Opitutaceae bacterium]
MNASTSPTDATTAAVSTNATNIQARTCTCWTEQDKAECLALFAQSGLHAAEFCRQLGISAATFSRWRRNVRSDDAPAVESGPHFAQVCLTEATPGVSTSATVAAVVVIHLPGGAKLEASTGTDPAWLAQLLKSLAST